MLKIEGSMVLVERLVYLLGTSKARRGLKISALDIQCVEILRTLASILISKAESR